MYGIILFFKRARGLDYHDVVEALKTDKDGTAERPIVEFLRRRKLRVSPRARLSWRDLLCALSAKSVVLVGLDGDHYGVVHGYDPGDARVYLADPSLLRQFWGNTPAKVFRRRWMGDGVIVSRRR